MNMDDKKSIIQSLISANDNSVIQTLVLVYEGQTLDEKSAEMTHHDNGIGFNGTDANFGSSLAKQYLERGTLSPRQIECARKMVKKYWKQVLGFYGEDLSAFTAPACIVLQHFEMVEEVEQAS